MNLESKSELLKQILENLRTPEKLNDHPWINSAFFAAYLGAGENTERENSGYKLAMAVSDLFLEMMPAAAPKRGKRLDTRWGEFGLLAAQYFAPFLFGLPYPSSLRDAWGKIDRAILLCRFGEKFDMFPAAEVENFRLVGNEPDVAPMSTISDWHVKGIEKLAVLIQDREQHISFSRASKSIDDNKSDSLASPVLASINVVNSKVGTAQGTRLKRLTAWVVVTFLLVGIIFLAGKVWTLYQLAQIVRKDAEQLQGFASPPFSVEKFMKAGPQLVQFREDVDRLRVEAAPFVRIAGPWLGGVPVYGADLADSANLLDLAGKTATAVDLSFRAATPLLNSLELDSAALKPQQLASLLNQSKPQFLEARRALDQAIGLRAGLNGKKYSPYTQTLLERLDPLLSILDDGLTMGVALPELMGTGNGGPKTYMLLIQNEDELRPTGGFITSVGTFVVKNGNLFGLQFEEAGNLEDWTLPYPDAPWQLAQYMNSRVLVLRDANWFTDYPTAVQWVEYLYAYTHKHSVDGVIAIDQHMLVSVLKTIGPISLNGISTPITSENVIEYMRSAKAPPVNRPADWYRKAFISEIANAVVARLLSNESLDWKGLAQMLVRNLNERHIILQFDDAKITDMLASLDLDGAIRPGGGDFLMAVDTNVGFNKTNAVVDTRFSYDIDLADLARPVGNLLISHTNHADSTISCYHLEEGRPEKAYPIHFCYWNYLRVYVPTGTRLDSASPHAVPADWMLLGQPVPARVDTLEENISGVQGFGTLMVVPGGQTLNTGFKFSLPASVISLDPISRVGVYTLKIKKQPGTIGVPITLRFHLPVSAQVLQAPAGAIIDGQNIFFETKLTTDIIIAIRFAIP